MSPVADENPKDPNKENLPLCGSPGIWVFWLWPFYMFTIPYAVLAAFYGLSIVIVHAYVAGLVSNPRLTAAMAAAAAGAAAAVFIEPLVSA